MITQVYFCCNELASSACVHVKTLISFRKALGQNKGYLSVENS